LGLGFWHLKGEERETSPRKLEDTMSNSNQLSESQIINLKGRKVGTEDLTTAIARLKWAKTEGFRPTSLMIADGIVRGLEVAVVLAESGDHVGAGKKAMSCLHVLQKDRTNGRNGNYHCLGNMEIECRDGNRREIGNTIKWFGEIHFRIAEQVEFAATAEAEAIAHLVEDEAETLALADSLVEEDILVEKAA
jgi:hypothetical protein